MAFSAEHEKNGQSSQQTQRNWMEKNEMIKKLEF